jgi:hypothetical protein
VLDAYPTALSLSGIKAGEVPSVRVVYQCASVDAAMRTIHEAVAVHGNVDAKYDRETGVLVMVFG